MRPLRLLILSYYCPPAGGPGVQRLEMLLRHLPPDVEATVLTAAVEDYQAFSPLKMPLDPGRFLPARGSLVRVSARLPQRLLPWLARCRCYGAVRFCWAPDVARNWARDVVRHAARLHQLQPFDVLFSTAPPFSAALAGRDCARSLGVPWVCDLQDLWSGYLLGAWPTSAHFARVKALEESVLREASIVVAATPGSREALLQTYSFLDPDRIASVTFGYDASAWPAPQPASPERFIVVHAGVFCGPEAPAGRLRRFVQGRAFEPRPVDRSTHSPVPLVRALELLGDLRVEFRHLGPMDALNQQLFERSPVRRQIQARGYRSHQETLSELAAADASYLCLATRLDAPRNELVPQKTYEYLGARKPVLAPIQEGDAKDFLAASGLGVCTPPADAAALAAALRRLVAAKFQGEPLAMPCEPFIRRFEWRVLAARVLDLLDAAASPRRPAACCPS